MRKVESCKQGAPAKKVKLDDVLAAYCRADLGTECMKKPVVLSGDFHFRFSAKNDVNFRSRFVYGRKWKNAFRSASSIHDKKVLVLKKSLGIGQLSQTDRDGAKAFVSRKEKLASCSNMYIYIYIYLFFFLSSGVNKISFISLSYTRELMHAEEGRAAWGGGRPFTACLVCVVHTNSLHLPETECPMQGCSPRGICLGARRLRGIFLAGSASPRPHTVLPRSRPYCLGLGSAS